MHTTAVKVQGLCRQGPIVRTPCCTNFPVLAQNIIALAPSLFKKFGDITVLAVNKKKMTFRIQNMSLSRIDLLYRELRLSLLCPFEPNPLLGKPWRWRCSHDDWIYFWIIFTTGHYLIVARNYRKLYGLVPWTHRWIWNERKIFYLNSDD